jgi:hypothetical protein
VPELGRAELRIRIVELPDENSQLPRLGVDEELLGVPDDQMQGPFRSPGRS